MISWAETGAIIGIAAVLAGVVVKLFGHGVKKDMDNIKDLVARHDERLISLKDDVGEIKKLCNELKTKP